MTYDLTYDYKELPCSRCGRVWKWAYDKKSEPYCPKGHGCSAEHPTTVELIENLMDRLDRIERKLDRSFPTYPPYVNSSRTCHKCGMTWDGVMGYVCQDMQCPIQFKTSC